MVVIWRTDTGITANVGGMVLTERLDLEPARSGHGLVTDDTDWAPRNVTRRNSTNIFPQVSGLGGTERHHLAWWSRNIKWKPGNEPDYG